MTAPHSEFAIDVEAMLRGAEELEPLPASTTRLAGLVSSPDWDMKDIVEVISLDQSLTGRILSMANSAAAAGRVAIRTVDMAVNRLGSASVVSLAIGSCVRQEMDTGLEVYDLGEGELFRHSVASALAAEKLVAFCAEPIPPESFATALLHDVGKLVLARNLGERGCELLKRMKRARGMDWHNAEREVLAIDHADLGGLVAEAWQLPDTIAEAVRHHHRPEECGNRRARIVAFTVALADQIAKVVGTGGRGEQVRPDELAPLMNELGLSRRGLRELVKQTESELGDVLLMYGERRQAA